MRQSRTQGEEKERELFLHLLLVISGLIRPNIRSVCCASSQLSYMSPTPLDAISCAISDENSNMDSYSKITHSNSQYRSVTDNSPSFSVSILMKADWISLDLTVTSANFAQVLTTVSSQTQAAWNCYTT